MYEQNLNKYYDRDARLVLTRGEETDRRESREVITYGDNCFIELDSVGEIDESVGFKPKYEPTCVSPKGNLHETDGNQTTKQETYSSVSNSKAEDGNKLGEQVLPFHNNQGNNSDAAKSVSCKPCKGHETDPNVNAFVRPSRRDNYLANTPRRKRKRQCHSSNNGYKFLKLHAAAEQCENFRSGSCNVLERKRSQKQIHVSTWSSSSFPDTETMFDDRTIMRKDNRSPLHKRHVRLNGRREVRNTIAKELIKYRYSDQDLKQRCFGNTDSENIKTLQDTIALPDREKNSHVDDMKYTFECSPTKTDLRHIQYGKHIQPESHIFRGNMKKLPPEVLTQLGTEVYRALVLSEQSYVSTKRAIEIMRNNESIQIDFEDEEELLYLLKKSGDTFLLKHVLGETIIYPRTNIKICKTFTNDQSSKHDCMDLHICKYYLLGSCSLKSCKFSHRLSAKHNNNVLRAHRLDGIPDRAVRALVSRIVNRNISTTPLICKFYNNEGGCQKGTACMHLHVCMHHINGNCKFGSKCKRSHDINEQQTRIILGRHGVSIVGNKKDDIINLIKATIQGGEVKLKRDMPVFAKRYIIPPSSEQAVSNIGQLQGVKSNIEIVPSLFVENNQVPKDDFTSLKRKETGNLLESNKLPDFIPLGMETVSENCLATLKGSKINGSTISKVDAQGTRTDKRFLPAWTSIWRNPAKKTDENLKSEKSVQREQIAAERIITDFDSTTRVSNVVENTTLMKDNNLRNGLSENDTGTGIRTSKDLAQPKSKPRNKDKEKTATLKSSNQLQDSEKKADISNSEEKSSSFHFNTGQDTNEEISSDPSNLITAVVLEMQDKNASYKIRRACDQWQFEDIEQNWTTLAVSDSDMLDTLFSNFANYSRQAITNANN